MLPVVDQIYLSEFLYIQQSTEATHICQRRMDILYTDSRKRLLISSTIWLLLGQRVTVCPDHWLLPGQRVTVCPDHWLLPEQRVTVRHGHWPSSPRTAAYVQSQGTSFSSLGLEQNPNSDLKCKRWFRLIKLTQHFLHSITSVIRILKLLWNTNSFIIYNGYILILG